MINRDTNSDICIISRKIRIKEMLIFGGIALFVGLSTGFILGILYYNMVERPWILGKGVSSLSFWC